VDDVIVGKWLWTFAIVRRHLGPGRGGHQAAEVEGQSEHIESRPEVS
jgi:hypothetical protein